jgi:hypothetical protein
MRNRLYRVYLWRAQGAARLVVEVRAPGSEAALQAVMQARNIPYVFAACVVPDNDRLPIADYQHVRCSLARPGEHGVKMR